MNKIQKITYNLARACEGNPVVSTIVVVLFYIMFSVLEATIERVIFGARFEHLLDPVFQCFFIGYSAYAVYWCGVFNSIEALHEDSK